MARVRMSKSKNGSIVLEIQGRGTQESSLLERMDIRIERLNRPRKIRSRCECKPKDFSSSVLYPRFSPATTLAITFKVSRRKSSK